VVQLTIDQSGHPHNIRIVAEYPPGFDFGKIAASWATTLRFPEGHAGTTQIRRLNWKLAT
jgi:hypothetical protein